MSSIKRDTQTRILDATRDLLESQGGKGVRMSDIAKAAGVSRQAIYLHFDSRAELLIAVTRHIDSALGVDARLAESRSATTGSERLEAFIRFWGGYLPDIQNIARAILAMRESDTEAAQAWDDRMQALREGCRAAIAALATEGALNPVFDETTATDLLWTMLSFESWDTLTRHRDWSAEDYVDWMQALARAAFVRA